MGFKATGAARKVRAPGGAGAGGGESAAGRRSRAPSAAPVPPGARRRLSAPTWRRADDTVARQAAPLAVRPGADWRIAVRAAVEARRYDFVGAERGQGGLLRVTIERRPGEAYAEPGEAVTVDDCEAVTRQLQYALEVDGVHYTRLEVSSPGLDRPLRSEADYTRFSGHPVSLTMREPFQGRRRFQGRLGRGEGSWQLTCEDGGTAQVLTFTLDEVREVRLVPVIDFKGPQRRACGQPGREAGGDQGGQQPPEGRPGRRAGKAKSST